MARCHATTNGQGLRVLGDDDIDIHNMKYNQLEERKCIWEGSHPELTTTKLGDLISVDDYDMIARFLVNEGVNLRATVKYGIHSNSKVRFVILEHTEYRIRSNKIYQRAIT